MERRSRKRSSSVGSEKMKRVGDRENGEVLFDRPKPTAGCSANGRRRFLYNPVTMAEASSYIVTSSTDCLEEARTVTLCSEYSLPFLKKVL
jgi:hypothetical protein